ncbi:hypothetical protein TNCV_2736301 [Trichonephila clavipes]|nr:hypothetical protein TNCV_2736301 [Trichonephila clavipes]
MYRNCGLSYRSVAARVGRDPMTVAEYGIGGSGTPISVISKVPYHKQLRRQPCYSHDLNRACSYFTSPESRIGVVCRIRSFCTNISTKFTKAWTLSSETMIVTTLDAASQTRASSMV